MTTKKIYWPATPAGSVIADEDHPTRQAAIDYLMAQLKKHGMPYPDWAAAEARGYEIIELEDE